jgi:3-dehydroquinate synthase
MDIPGARISDGQLSWPTHRVISTSAYRKSTYSIHITSSDHVAIGVLAAEIGSRAAAIVTDHKVDALYAADISCRLADHGIKIRSIAIPEGERSKNLHTAYGLLDWLSQIDFERRDVLLAVGGGVVIDTAGWVASTYMRGVPYINVPTTLLAQVDAAIGGKVGVDHSSAKNLVGAFYQPSAVVSYVGYLATLDPRQVRAGLAEVIKKAVIASPQLFEFIERQLGLVLALDPPVLLSLVQAATAIKSRLVERDPYETDLRRSLNFGHTVGHAVETATGYGPVLHGEAVAFGMAVALRIAATRGLLDDATAMRIVNLLTAAGLPVRHRDLPSAPRAEDVLAALKKIRQVRDGGLRFVLPTGIGSTVVCDHVTDEEIRAAFHAPMPFGKGIR